jgi:hypothetical protein
MICWQNARSVKGTTEGLGLGVGVAGVVVGVPPPVVAPLVPVLVHAAWANRPQNTTTRTTLLCRIFMNCLLVLSAC